jgi:hypothetical protein
MNKMMKNQDLTEEKNEITLILKYMIEKNIDYKIIEGLKETLGKFLRAYHKK